MALVKEAADLFADSDFFFDDEVVELLEDKVGAAECDFADGGRGRSRV